MAGGGPITETGDKIGEIVAAIVSLAVLAVVVSNSANTVNVISSFFAGITNLIGVALSPITGSNVNTAAGLAGGNWTAGASSSSGFSVPNVLNPFSGISSMTALPNVTGSSGSSLSGLTAPDLQGGAGLTDAQYLSSIGAG